MSGEDLGHRHPGSGDDQFIEVGNGGVEEAGNQTPDGGLAGPGQPYQNEVPLHRSGPEPPVPSSLQRRPRLATYPS